MHITKVSHFPHLPYAQSFQGFALTKVQTFAHKCTQTFQTCTKKDPPSHSHTLSEIYTHISAWIEKDMHTLMHRQPCGQHMNI